jgi:hypothetical protein
MAYFLCDPQATLNYSHDWSTLWLETNDSIVSRQWTITPANAGSPGTPTLVGDTTDVVFVSGLLAGTVYRLVERVTTSAGVVDERSIVLRCEDT